MQNGHLQWIIFTLCYCLWWKKYSDFFLLKKVKVAKPQCRNTVTSKKIMHKVPKGKSTHSAEQPILE